MPGEKAKEGLATKVERLARVRRQLKALESEEQLLTMALKAYMKGHGLSQLHADRNMAVLSERVTRVIRPHEFIGLVGFAEAMPALKVVVETAERMISGDAIDAISDKVPTDVLRTVPLFNGMRNADRKPAA